MDKLFNVIGVINAPAPVIMIIGFTAALMAEATGNPNVFNIHINAAPIASLNTLPIGPKKNSTIGYVINKAREGTRKK